MSLSIRQLFRYRSTSFALLAGAQGCTLTATDYSPQLVTAESSDGSSAVTDTGEASTANPDASNGSASSETFTPGTLVENEDSLEAEPDSGARAVDAAPPVPALPELDGFASVAGLGVATTTGGGDTPAVLVETAEELLELAARPEPLVLAIAGTLDVGALALSSNKTLFGTNASATLRGGISVRGTPESYISNVIIHNLNIDAATSEVGGDGIELRYAHHVWIDHCEIRDAADGLLDIVRGSDFVTVSSTRFRYTAAAPDPLHRFAVLVGHDAGNAVEDQDHLNVTWHHDWWSDDVTRALLGRFGAQHLYNNLFASSGNEAVVEADVGSSLLLENNIFAGVTAPHLIRTGSEASLTATGNVYLDTTGPRDTAGIASAPPYEYQLEPPLAPRATDDIGPQ